MTNFQGIKCTGNVKLVCVTVIIFLRLVHRHQAETIPTVPEEVPSH